MRFIDLFAGLGGFHYALEGLGHECVFASELDDELRTLYKRNFYTNIMHGDIRESCHRVPQHDILCAGFPCQPFSKSGAQRGSADVTRGTLFHEIIGIVAKHRPRYVILENVGNFERHDGGRTWRIARQELEKQGYDVRGTVHIGSGGHGLISPHHFGYPHHRERFFIVASLDPLPVDPFPTGDRRHATSLETITMRQRELTSLDRQETALTPQQRFCIEHWNTFLHRLPAHVQLPSVPLWSDEFGAAYPFEEKTPFASSANALRKSLGIRRNGFSHDQLLQMLPSYSRRQDLTFPEWKIRFIRQNREWYVQNRRHVSDSWLHELRGLPASLRKLEWNCDGDERDLWNCVLQFRPSGLRAKRYNNIPALVAMTTTQIPILGPKQRFLTRVEGLRLQGFPDSHQLPSSRQAAFAALGNAVHVGVVRLIAEWLLTGKSSAKPSEQFRMSI